jgi:hypothetical protein
VHRGRRIHGGAALSSLSGGQAHGGGRIRGGAVPSSLTSGQARGGAVPFSLSSDLAREGWPDLSWRRVGTGSRIGLTGGLWGFFLFFCND